MPLGKKSFPEPRKRQTKGGKNGRKYAIREEKLPGEEGKAN